MKKLRKHVAVAIDGGGIKGVMVAKALSMLEEKLGRPCGEIFRIAAGTSTGSILSAGMAVGLTATEMLALYRSMAASVFRKTWQYYLWPLARCKYGSDALTAELRKVLAEKTMGSIWNGGSGMDLVVTVRDLVENRTRFLKPWKEEYRDWLIWKAVLASCAVPAYFPVVEGRYVDGGVGAYSNPCYLAAYEAAFCLKWDPAETTLLSFGTGRSSTALKPNQAGRFFPWQWLSPLLDTFLSDASDQQVRVVRKFFPGLDFRRFQLDIDPIEMDDVTKIDDLVEYGRQLGDKMLRDEDDDQSIRLAGRASAPRKTAK
jgi:hypothetical protein